LIQCSRFSILLVDFVYLVQARIAKFYFGREANIVSKPVYVNNFRFTQIK